MMKYGYYLRIGGAITKIYLGQNPPKLFDWNVIKPKCENVSARL